MKYSDLQNGSDIRGIAMENEWNETVNLTEDAVRHLAGAFAVWLSKRNGRKNLHIAAGHDSRLTGERLLQAAFTGINSQGAKSLNLGLASTPAMFMSTVLDPCHFDGSIMITASHLPYHRNGMKFFTPDGGLEKDEIKELTEIASGLTLTEPFDAAADKVDFMSVYESYLCNRIKKGVNASDYDQPLKGLQIIVDAGNGDGGFFVSGVLQKLGAETTGSQFLEPDGHFPNHIPNPEDQKAAASVQAATILAHADLGIIFDTDVDRAGAVLADGRTLTRNALIAVLSRIALAEHPGTTIVTDSVTSSGLAGFITAHGGVHRRFKRGYKNVIDESIRLNKEGTDSQLAIETSGHGAWKENFFLDDGAYLMVKLLIEMGKGNRLEDMIADLQEPAESIEIRFPVTAENIAENGDRILEMLRSAAEQTEGWSLEPENFEGVRINCDPEHGNGWLLLRKSLHEPIMPLNIESDSKGGNLIIGRTLARILEKAEGIEQKPLTDFIA